MANKIQTRRGLKAKLPSSASADEPLFSTDSHELFMGTGSGIVNMTGSHWYNGTAMSGTSSTSNAYYYNACPEVKLGDYYLNTSYGYVYECTTAGSGTTARWTYRGTIKGAAGKGVSSTAVAYQSGTSGTTAPTGTWSSSIPSVAAGSYLWTRTVITYTDNTTKTIYSAARQGTTGETGQRGSEWYTGTAMSGTSTITGAYTWNDSEQKYVNDMYLNTSNGNIYRCTTAGTGTSAKWTYRGCIKGTISDVTLEIGDDVSATGNVSVALGGESNTASGSFAATLGGRNNEAEGLYSVALGGLYNKALQLQVKMGHYSQDGTAGNNYSTTGDALIIGNGTSSSNSNAFRVTYAGGVYGKAAYNSTGADYAEMFEWEDGNPNNEDRRGLFAYVVGDKIRLATVADTDRRRMGIISAYPAVVGDNFDEDWCGKWLTDIYGKPLTQTVHHEAEYEEREITDPETGETKTENILVHEAFDAEEWILNPDYDPDKEYIPRAQRKEYAYWSFIGKLVVRDDGTCTDGGYCYPGKDGVATACTDPDKGYYVMERLDDNHVRVLVR